MEQSTSITDRIRTMLEKGKTPQEVIAQGYAKSTVYAIAKKLKPKLDLLPIEKLEERLKCLENLAIQLISIARAKDVICPKCAKHPFRYFETKNSGIWINGYKCSGCGYRIEF